MQTTVKWFNAIKGYGFLDNGAGPDIYVNAKGLPAGHVLEAGDIVQFECHVFDGKLVARDVKPGSSQTSQPSKEDIEDGNSDNFGNDINHDNGNRNPFLHRDRVQQPHYVMR